MAKKLTRQVEIEFARVLFDALVDAADNQDDEVYELMDPEYEYDSDELCKRLNNDTIKEVIALGFRAKYGVDLHPDPAEPKRKWCERCETPGCLKHPPRGED